MKIKLSSGTLIVGGNDMMETVEDIQLSIICEAINKTKEIREYKGIDDFIRNIREHVTTELHNVVGQIPGQDLGKYFRILLFRYVTNTFLEFCEELWQADETDEEIRKIEEESIKTGGEKT